MLFEDHNGSTKWFFYNTIDDFLFQHILWSSLVHWSAVSLCSQLLHKIEATSVQLQNTAFSSMYTLFPTPIPKAPPEAPSSNDNGDD